MRVAAGAVDVGDRKLSVGAKLSGSIRYVRPCRLPDEIVAMDSSGVSVHHAFLVYSSYDQFNLAGLWPGRWTVSLRGGDEVLATSAVEVGATGTFPVTLTVGQVQ